MNPWMDFWSFGNCKDSWKYKAQVLRPLKEKKRTTIYIKRYFILNEIIQLYCFFLWYYCHLWYVNIAKNKKGKKMPGMSGLVLLKRVADSRLSLSLSPKLVFSQRQQDQCCYFKADFESKGILTSNINTLCIY